jgi:hypothetical protein
VSVWELIRIDFAALGATEHIADPIHGGVETGAAQLVDQPAPRLDVLCGKRGAVDTRLMGTEKSRLPLIRAMSCVPHINLWSAFQGLSQWRVDPGCQRSGHLSIRARSRRWSSL